jgi:DNA modification methylase
MVNEGAEMNRKLEEEPAEDIEPLNEEEALALGLWLPPEPEAWADIGEVDAKNWRDYDDITTSSLWIIGSRSRDGVHTGKYHGNFVPQIPYQAIRRFTKPGDVVLDTFAGSGTTLIEARRLGRHGIGIELVDSIATEARRLIDSAGNPYQTWQEVIKGDSANIQTIEEVRRLLEAKERHQVQLLVMHPPYHDIIKFSDDPHDLSNMPTVPEFLEAFRKVVCHTYDLLEPKHFLVVVIGDIYSNKEWTPLGFRTMEAVQSVGYTLKSIVVKNMEGNRAKRNLQNLWRQRAFKGNYYIFKHEYVLFFQKTGYNMRDEPKSNA